LLIGPPLSTAIRLVLFVSNDTSASLRAKGRGRLGMILIAPPIAPSPYMTEAGPRSTSILSADQLSRGNVRVPAPT